jgi:hypothetical protein
MSDANRNRVRCRAIRRDGTPCQGSATHTGLCIAHDPRAAQWRVMGGHASRRSERAMKLLPARFEPTIDLLEKTLKELYFCKMPIKLGEAMAQVGAVLVKILSTAEMEERLRAVERKVQAIQSGTVQEDQQRWSA